MNIQEIYELGLAQGWDEADAFYLAQLAWAESKGDPYAVKEEDDGTWSLGIWQINSIHILNLIEAGIINVEGIGEEAAFGGDPDAEEYLQWLEAVRTQLADPQVQADAAWFVGHRMDYSEPWEDWDWTRWGSHGLEMTDVNFPGNYGGDIDRTFVEESPAGEESPWNEAELPADFVSTVTGLSDWTEAIEEWGLTDSQQTLALRYLFKQYNEYGGPTNGIGSWIEDPTSDSGLGFMSSLSHIGDYLATIPEQPPIIGPGSDYTPGTGSLPMGWLSYWGEDNEIIGEWLDMWLDRFNQNAALDIPYSVDDLEEDFFTGEDGLYAQDWWKTQTSNWLSMAELWYTGGGPGTTFDVGLPTDGSGDYEDLENWDNWEGTGDWQQIWNDSIVVIRSVAEDLGIEGKLSDALVNGLAFKLMSAGGATAHLSPNFATNWSVEAHQIIENDLIKWLESGELDMELGVGSIQDIMNDIYSHAASQLITVTDEEVRAWALDIKSEQGLNKNQVFATLDNRAYGMFGLTPDFVEGLGSNPLGGQITISDIVSPLHDAATSVWEDDSYRKNDQWLMDNYQEVAEDGTKRFRTAQEMRNLARTNLDRFQHSKQYQTPLNNFIRGAAAMFRSDY